MGINSEDLGVEQFPTALDFRHPVSPGPVSDFVATPKDVEVKRIAPHALRHDFKNAFNHELGSAVVVDDALHIVLRKFVDVRQAASGAQVFGFQPFLVFRNRNPDGKCLVGVFVADQDFFSLFADADADLY